MKELFLLADYDVEDWNRLIGSVKRSSKRVYACTDSSPPSVTIIAPFWKMREVLELFVTSLNQLDLSVLYPAAPILAMSKIGLHSLEKYVL